MIRLLARCQQATWTYDEWPMHMRGPLFDHIEPHPSWADAFFALVGRFCFRGWIV